MMPEVIDLVSSTPPQPPDSVRRQSNANPAPPPPPSTVLPPSSQNFLSSDFDPAVFNYDDIEVEKPPNKRIRLTPEIEEISSSKGKDLTSPPTAGNSSLYNIFSDDDPALLPPSKQKDAVSSTRTYSWDGEKSDPIVFTSSAPEPTRSRTTQNVATSRTAAKATITIDDDDVIEEFTDPIQSFDDLLRVEPPRLSRGLSDRTASLLASLGDRITKGGESNDSRESKGSKKITQPVSDDDVSEPDIAPAPKKQRKTGKATAVDKEAKEAKARERAAAKAERERIREEEKAKKQKLKEEKAKEKQLAADIAQVNKLKVDKTVSTPDMIVDLSSSLEDSSVGNQVNEFMKRLNVEYHYFTSSIPGMVKWRRKVVAKFNEELGYWEPCPHYIGNEQHVLCLLTAQEFVDMVIAEADSDNTLQVHVSRIKSAYPDCRPIYMIEGLTAWMRKNQNARNRAYQAEVLRDFPGSNPQPPSGTQSRRKARKPETTPPVDDDLIEDALLELQVTHSCLIQHTAAPAESAEWIKTFTEHISTIPYRRERMDVNDAGFCMDVGQVKSGEDKSDTFIKMLQEVTRVTAPIAYGIATKYPSVVDLVQGMRVHGPTMLEDVKVCYFPFISSISDTKVYDAYTNGPSASTQKSANKNGALTESRIGPAVSRRLYKVFMGRDPASTDI
ncbi:hypothetical protein NFIA_073810 [Paecilomyces variotii No. 5]|uniref:ERCC4 domain-containing protein n=1 Tax=Byssochlamys spectabilis (strain No. 5 / NBRC 109023) TaxID=1356009 RepID=V5FX28_BYSSN|nr:hypothetical protein NFIA_073810 [Paecilomyces variotii No. 5]